MKITMINGETSTCVDMCWQLCLDANGHWYLEWDETPNEGAGFQKGCSIDVVKSVGATVDWEKDALEAVLGLLNK